MTDHELAELERLSSGGADLKAINRYLKDKVAHLPGVRMRCGPDIKRHALLRTNLDLDDSMSGAAPSKVWWDLAGSGDQYNGLFGALDGNGDPVDLLRTQQRFETPRANTPPLEMAPLAAQCARFLAGTLAVSSPNLARRVQLLLNEILLEHPVLMHPGLLCPTLAEGGIGVQFMSIAHALAQSRCGTLPRLRHYGESMQAPKPTSGMISRLRDFWSHPCVRLGVGQCVVVRPNHDGVYKRETAPLPGILKKGLPRSGVSRAFAASVMELDDIVAGGNAVSAQWHSAPLPLDPGDAPEKAEVWRAWTRLVLQSLFMDAAAVSNDTEVLDCFRRRSEALTALGFRRDCVDRSLCETIFAWPSNPTSALDVWTRTRDLCAALVHANVQLPTPEYTGDVLSGGTVQDMTTQRAAFYILEYAIGRLGFGTPLRRKLPDVDAGAAIAFLRAIDDMGGFGSMAPGLAGTGSQASRIVAHFQRAVASEEGFPDGCAPVWTQALHAFWAEKSMQHVIHSATQAAPAPECVDRGAAVSDGVEGDGAAQRRAPRIRV